MTTKVIQKLGTLLDITTVGKGPDSTSRFLFFNSMLVIAFLLLGLGASAQAQQVSGTVVDGSGESLPGVNILVKGTTTGTTTGSDGAFQLNVPSLQDTLVFSFIGFQRQEVPIDGRETINIQMVSQTYAGEELVVVGYGTQKRETLTGSVSAVGGEELQKSPVANTSNSIGGKLPGVVSVTSSGEPGYDGSTIRIRGQHTLGDNSPLVVIDGIPSDANALDRLNPQDIEDMTVLKDASAAIYGSQAANGVILVTTKRGASGEPELTIDFNQGFNQPTRIPDMADAPTYLRMLNEVDMYRGNDPRYSQEEIQKHENIDQQDPWLYHDTDWFAEALKPISLQTQADLAMSGGSENMQYRISLGALTEDGYYENSATGFNQYNFRSNIDGQVNENINIQFDVSGRYEDRNFPTQPAGATFRMLMRGKPQLPAYWPNGLPGPDIENGQNPVVTGTDATGYDQDDRYYLTTNLVTDIEIPGVEGLNVRGTFSYNKELRERKQWLTPWTLYGFDADGYRANGGDPEQYLTGASRPSGQEPQLTQWSDDNYDLLYNAVVQYQRDFDDHYLSLLGGIERRESKNAWFTAFRRNYISPAIDQLFAGGEAQRSNDGSGYKEKWQSFFSRINYDYQSKYLIELVARYDGSYKFPQNDRYGFFPAVSVGWRLTEEEFFTNNVEFFDNFKLRASWGQTGNDRVDPYQYLASYGFGGGYIFGGGVEVPSLYQTRTPNPNITWEVANQFDVGIEASMLDNRLSVEVDYFDYLRTDILTQRNASIPQTSGLTLPEENIGEVSSYGVDGSINWSDQVNEDFIYDISLNAGWATNEIKYWDEAPGAPEWQQSTGSKMETELYYVADGVFQNQEDIDQYGAYWGGNKDAVRPGDIKFKDIDGDGEITADDRVRSDRNNIPEWTGGITFSASYKQFDFTAFFQGAAGASQYIQTESGDFGNYFAQFAEKRWRPDPDNPMLQHPDQSHAEGPRAFQRTEEYWIANQNTYFFRNTDYVRLKTLEIGYNMPSDLTSKIGMKNMRVYLNGFNLLTWDSFGLMDPETQNGAGSYYPQKRVFNAGISLTF
ncbi:SusC/RagA family TonB-linked outer membrane protein [Fodinibius sediminis]|uniref:TonB-linked outer membrane protein, SusC/RagA family n=1 Tax=Fodinibius sediminis TaxID=1214077 RepID=A0A521CS80_9BACT|nr:TonB-dependent receptor [Fodinibius sediminis]SMO62324.1 TonB-linked outer membrane protein, SusC/RagA family [Fodinibius sediminis]